MNNQSLKYGIFENKYLIGAFILGTLLQMIVVIIPSIAQIFKLTTLTSVQWLYTLGISVLPIVIMEMQKKIEKVQIGRRRI